MFLRTLRRPREIVSAKRAKARLDAQKYRKIVCKLERGRAFAQFQSYGCFQSRNSNLRRRLANSARAIVQRKTCLLLSE